MFFTRVKEQDGPIFLIMKEEPAPKTITISVLPVGACPADPGIRPADPGDFPPSAIVVTLNTVKAWWTPSTVRLRFSMQSIPADPDGADF